MSLTDYVIMPGEDYQAICDAIREKTETTEPIKSGDAAGMIQAFQGGGEVIKGLCEGTAFDIKSDEVEFVADYVFANSDALVKNVDLPNAKTIGVAAFRYSKVETVSFPSATTIEISAFEGCNSLKTAEIPNVVTLGQEAFSYSGLLSIDLPEVETVPRYAFRYCGALKTANFSKAQKIFDYAFFECKALTDVYAPRAWSLDVNTFEGCSLLETVTLSDAIPSLPEGVFARCTSLKSLAAPAVVTIGASAFSQCTSFQGFDASNGAATPSTIGASAFYDCKALTSEAVKTLTFNVGVIEQSTFESCSNIVKADLLMATEIKAAAFSNCSSLTALILRTTETVCVMDFTAFYGTPIFNLQGYIYVPTAMYEYYRAGYSDALDAAYAEMGVTIPGGVFNVMFRKTEDYPEICG